MLGETYCRKPRLESGSRATAPAKNSSGMAVTGPASASRTSRRGDPERKASVPRSCAQAR